MAPPARPNIYHIVHVDRLASIIADGYLWSDAKFRHHARPGTPIGMREIKQRRLSSGLDCHPGLHVGDCVPFYFCPRSVMLYMIHKKNDPNLTYQGGQEPIVHLQADFHEVIKWADAKGRRWAFTLSNAGSSYFEDRCDLAQLQEIDWDAVRAIDWSKCKEGKQAEFLVEGSFPWKLVRCVGVYAAHIQVRARGAIEASQRPDVKIIRPWYYWC